MEATATPLSIAHVDTETGFSGGEVQVFLLLEGLRERGHRNLVLCTPGSKIETRARDAGFETLGVKLRNYFDIAGVWRVRRALRASEVDLVHLHTGKATWLGGWGAKLAGLPALSTRRMDREVKRGLRTSLIYGVLVRRVAAISPAVVECLTAGGVPSAKIVKIASAVDPAALNPGTGRAATRQSLGAEPEKLVILTLASLHPRKGIDVLLEALSKLDGCELDGRVPSWVLWIAGDGPQRQALEELRDRLALGDRVRFLGQRPDASDLLAACDLCVLPSRREGLGVAALEAMAAGRPLIASRVGGLADTVVDGDSGRLVPPEDANALAEALEGLMSDRELREQLARNGPARVAQGYLPNQMVDAYERLYREILAGGDR